MHKLSADMRRIIGQQKLGFVASVGADGAPNLSPKGTFLVLDEEHVMFGEMRSPNTVDNISRRPVVEVNFVDVLSRKGCRLKGPARIVDAGSAEYQSLLPGFIENWGEELCALFNRIVVIKVETAGMLTSPAYDIGAQESELRRHWLGYFTSLQSAPE